MRARCLQRLEGSWRNACLALAIALGFATSISCPPRALAHGPPPAAVAVVDDDADGPKFIRLSGGFARRVDEGYQFVCHAAWGDVLALPAAKIPDGPIAIAAGNGIYLVDEAGVATQHPDIAARMPVTDFAQLEGKLYALRSSAGSTQVLDVDATHVRMIFSEPGTWSAIATTSNAIALQRFTAARVEQLRISPEGTELGRESATPPGDVIAITARATSDEFYSILATPMGRELGQIQAGNWQSLSTAIAAIAGPVQASDGEAFVAVDMSLARWPNLDDIVAGAAQVTCLGRSSDRAYACVRGGLVALSGAGLGASIFELSSITPPDLAKVPELQRELCDSQWEHFRFDLLALGVELKEPVVSAGAGGAAGRTGASGSGKAGSAAGSGGKRAPERDEGCSVAGAGIARTRLASLVSLGVAGCVFTLRRIRRSRKRVCSAR